MKTRKKYLLIPVITACGFGIGMLFFSFLVSGYAERTSRSLLLYSAPSEKLYRPVNAFYSDVIDERIAAYYAALEIDYISVDFLKKRFEEESQPAEKRVILFVIQKKNEKAYAELKAKYTPENKKFRDIPERPYRL